MVASVLLSLLMPWLHNVTITDWQSQTFANPYQQPAVTSHYWKASIKHEVSPTCPLKSFWNDSNIPALIIRTVYIYIILIDHISWHFHHIIMSFSWHDHDIIMTLSWHYHDIIMTLSWHYHDIIMTLSWHYHDIIMTLSWHYHDIIMTLSWHYHDIIMSLSWHYHDIIMTLSWHYHDIIMTLSWHYHDICVIDHIPTCLHSIGQPRSISAMLSLQDGDGVRER